MLKKGKEAAPRLGRITPAPVLTAPGSCLPVLRASLPVATASRAPRWATRSIQTAALPVRHASSEFIYARVHSS